MAQLITKKDSQTILDSFDMFLFDLSGVVWSGNKMHPGAVELIQKLQKMGKKVLVATNNSSETQINIQEKLAKKEMNFDIEDIYCSTNATIDYLKKINYQDKIFVLGQKGITEELEKNGFNFITAQEVEQQNLSLEDVDLDDEIGCVIIGTDQNLNYYQIGLTCLYLAFPSKKGPRLYIAPNADRVYPVGDRTIPGPGTFIAACQTTTRRYPTIVAKPDPFIFQLIQKRFPDILPHRVCIVGDQFDTDILFAQNSGIRSLCVLTGLTSESMILENVKSGSIVPDFYCEDLTCLL
ncbi:hypothetical protein M0811_02660 [Anaeramoeba ignava]|uniref:4-nitrophenylphosphatase n=1 Tax=Anaeramoeba ignava TaxID=1746090 RepID=A0A9Q0L9B1_ANAIG|nr:hypothetical protein M0811_02660 [Anaeramoeba ignava]